jgi:multicomponent Na+:H+ antiporter subunit D
VMLIASFVLIALGNERAQIEGAIKYVTLNLVATALLLASIGITYGLTGTLNMAALSQAMAESDSPGLVQAVSMLFLAAFGIKAAAFPFFFWLPASYHTPPAAVSALFAGLLTKVGVYALIRIFTLIFSLDSEYTRNVILFIAGATMLTGVLGTVAQHEFRRILSFHIVSQIGYMLMGLGLASPLALAGSVLYLIHIIIVKANLFLISGLVHRLRGTYELKLLGGMFRSHPGIAALFAVSALSLAGIPPFSGFFAKFVLVRAGLEAEQYAIVGVALGVSLLTVFSMAKIWREVFWKPVPEEAAGFPHERLRAADLTMVGPIVAMAVLIVAIGIGIEPLLQLTADAAEQLVNPAIYVGAVLGGSE